MKYIIIGFINFYQIIVSPIIKLLTGVKNSCRFTVSCSEYAKRSINSYGVVKGSYLTLKRLLSCQPFGTIR